MPTKKKLHARTSSPIFVSIVTIMRRLAKRRMAKRQAGIMKIHSYSTSPRHEEANTRTANSTRRAAAAAAAAKQPNGASRGDSSARRLQRPTRTVRNNTPVATRNRKPELDNKANRLAVATARRRTQLEKLKEHQRTSSANSAEEEEEDEEVAEGELDPLDDEETDEVVEEEEEAEEKQESDGEASAAKRPRREVKVVATRTAKATPQQSGKRGAQRLVRIATEKQQAEEEGEQEEEEEDDGTSSSTASAEEEIGEEMEPLGPKGGPRVVSAASRVSLGRGSSSAVARGSNTTIVLTEEDYDEQQDQQLDEEDAAMDEYEGGAAGAGVLGGGSEDMEDTDGALTGNRLFRKKVKRKVPTRTNSASAGSSLVAGGLGGATNQITSSKAKLQMLQEFPTLFIGLRRNRMFLVNSLAQSFDLNQRDIVLTLRKIKQNESSARLANFFGIGAAEVDLLFHTSVPKIADCLRNFIVWPDDFTMKLNVPISLRQHFNRIHLILNYLVLRVKQNAVQELPPSEIGTAYCPVDQCHKLKYLVASTLDGCVCFVSRAFGVQTDDEQLLAQSGFLTKFKTNTNLIAGQNFHNFEDRLANGHDHTNNNGGGGGRNRRTRTAGGATDDDDLERVLGGGGSCDEDNFEDIVSEKISKSRTFKLKNYIENILENFQNHQMLSPHTCIDGRTFKLLDDIVVIVGALINLQKQEID